MPLRLTTSLVVLLCASPLARAADAAGSATPAKKAVAEPADYAPVLARVLETLARGVIERHVATDAYQVFVTVKAKAAATTDLPYMPDGLTAAGVAALPVEALSAFIAKADVEVLLAERYNKLQPQLAAMIERTLKLDKARGDSVAFTKLAIDLPLPKSELELALAKAEADGRDLKTRLDAAGRERDDVKRDLSLAKSELDKTGRSSKDTGSDSAKITPSLADTAKANLPILAACLVLLVGLLLLALIIRGAATAMGNAVRSIGEGLPQLGDKLSAGLGSRGAATELPTISARALEAPAQAAHAGRGGGDSALSALPLEALHARILLLHEELVSTLRERGAAGETLALKHLAAFLEQSGQAAAIGLAVATLEILGQDLAKTLFQKLSPDQQRTALDFLAHGRHDRPKAEVMLEAGEALKTKMMLSEAAGSGRARLDGKVAEQVMQFSPVDLAGWLESADGELLPRLFLYLEAETLGEALSLLNQRSRERFLTVSQAVAKLPAAEAAVAIDGTLLASLLAYLQRTREDTQRPYLHYYKALVEAVDDKAAEQLSTTLAAEGSSVERYLRENVMTFNVFFQLQPSIQEEITDALTTKDLAALLAGLGEGDQGRLRALLDDKRRELAQEEVERLNSRGSRAAEAAHRRAKQDTVQRILALKGDGTLLDMLATSSQAPPKAAKPDNTNMAA